MSDPQGGRAPLSQHQRLTRQRALALTLKRGSALLIPLAGLRL